MIGPNIQAIRDACFDADQDVTLAATDVLDLIDALIDARQKADDHLQRRVVEKQAEQISRLRACLGWTVMGYKTGRPWSEADEDRYHGAMNR